MTNVNERVTMLERALSDLGCEVDGDGQVEVVDFGKYLMECLVWVRNRADAVDRREINGATRAAARWRGIADSLSACRDELEELSS